MAQIDPIGVTFIAWFLLIILYYDTLSKSSNFLKSAITVLFSTYALITGLSIIFVEVFGLQQIVISNDIIFNMVFIDKRFTLLVGASVAIIYSFILISDEFYKINKKIKRKKILNPPNQKS